MTRTIKVEQVTTLKDYTTLVENALPQANHLLWYRGVGQSTHDLTPGLYRNPPTTIPAELQNTERKMVTRFRQRSIPFQTRPLDDFWECLFVMQHFGVPTRLLDWTENPYIALYFALTTAPKTKKPKNKWTYEYNATVWLLNPVQWNAAILEGVDVEGGVLSTNVPLLSGYNAEKGITRDEPIAIYGAHNSTRIVAQRGVFTVAGSNLLPLNKVYEVSSKKIEDTALTRLEIPKDKIADILQSLLSIGFTESVVFPDMEGLAREIKRIFKF